MREGEPKFEEEFPKKSSDRKEPVLEKEISSEQEEVLLKTAEIEESHPISDKGINETQYVSFKGGGAGIFKPKSGEKQVPKMEDIFPVGTYYKRERAAYVVDKALGFDIVPPTEIRTINGQEGSIQKFVENATSLNLIPQEQRENPEFQNELIKAWVFDYIINQSDSADENLLVKGGKVSGIDNGLSFEETQTEFDYNNFWKQPMPAEVKGKIESFFSDKKNMESLEEQLSELLSPEEVKACLGRAESVKGFIDKEVGWQKKMEEIEGAADGMGLGIDKKVQETIAGLNLLGFPTSQSCEGHMRWGTPNPWVRISAPDEPKQFIGQDKIYQEIAVKYNLPVEEVERSLPGAGKKAWLEAQKTISKQGETPEHKQWRSENKRLKKEAGKLLKKFYKGRKALPYVQLKIDGNPEGDFEIKNGASKDQPYSFLKKKLSKEQTNARKKRMAKCQQEMRDFGKFLKEEYFA